MPVSRSANDIHYITNHIGRTHNIANNECNHHHHRFHIGVYHHNTHHIRYHNDNHDNNNDHIGDNDKLSYFFGELDQSLYLCHHNHS